MDGLIALLESLLNPTIVEHIEEYCFEKENSSSSKCTSKKEFRALHGDGTN